MWMNLENWSSWELCYCRKSSLNFIVHIHKTLRTPSISSCKIHFLLSVSNADFQLGLIYFPICSCFQVLSVLFSCQKNMSHIFPVCLILLLPALSRHPAFFLFFFLFYFSLCVLQGRNPVFLNFCIYKALHWLFSDKKGTADSLIYLWQCKFMLDG